MRNWSATRVTIYCKYTDMPKAMLTLKRAGFTPDEIHKERIGASDYILTGLSYAWKGGSR